LEALQKNFRGKHFSALASSSSDGDAGSSDGGLASSSADSDDDAGGKYTKPFFIKLHKAVLANDIYNDAHESYYYSDDDPDNDLVAAQKSYNDAPFRSLLWLLQAKFACWSADRRFTQAEEQRRTAAKAKDFALEKLQQTVPSWYRFTL
jgi:hypothetical protein